MALLHFEAQQAQLKVDEKDLQIGIMRAVLKSKNIKDNEDLKLPQHHDDANSDSESNEEASKCTESRLNPIIPCLEAYSQTIFRPKILWFGCQF